MDSRDQVFVFNRSELPVIVFDRQGSFVRAWGEGMFRRPHGIHVAPDDTIWCVDDEGQRVVHLTQEGEVLLEIAEPDQSLVTGYVVGHPHSVVRSSGPFCWPTGAFVGPHGDEVWVTDGYGNARVHRFGIDGSLLGSWGDPGLGPGQFVIPHGVLCEPDGRLLISDRENERVQCVGADGRVLSIWSGVNCPNNVARYLNGAYVVAELGRKIQGVPPDRLIVPDAMPPRLTIRDAGGNLLAEVVPPETAVSEINWFTPHGIAADSVGDVYVGEVPFAYSDGRAPRGLPTLHKLVRVC